MNKKTKGALAAAAGGALLLGGAGSLAYWSSSTVIGGQEISSGTLKIGACENGEWTENGAVLDDVSSFLLVPGETLTFTCSAAITATGDHLTGTITADKSAITGNPELLAAIHATTTILLGDTEIATISDANDGETVDITVDLEFDAGTELEVAQGEKIQLAALELVLEQTAPH